MPKKSMNYGKPKKYDKFNWRTIFQKNSGGFSSKRICGLIGWFLCLGILLTGFIFDMNIPQYGELIAITSASLLGIDSVTGIWQKQINQ